MDISNAEHIKTEIVSAQGLLRDGKVSQALAQLLALQAASTPNFDIEMNLALAFRHSGELAKALTHINAALAIEPYSFIGLLSKGLLEEQTGAHQAAAETYSNAIKIAPDQSQLNEPLRKQLEHAHKVSRQYSEKLERHLEQSLINAIGSLPNNFRNRGREFVRLAVGNKKNYVSEAVQLQYPQLPAIPFHERDDFPWLDFLEQQTETIVDELSAFILEKSGLFEPYVQYQSGTPENQFADLNNNTDWSSIWLWRDGVPQEQHLAGFQKTSAILNSLPLFDLAGLGPTAVVSSLAPGAHIPPHTGSTNVRLLVHLPLILTGDESFRVGSQIRSWRMGEAWVFDDTIEHEAWNHGGTHRYILILDVWNPALSLEERLLIKELMVAKASFNHSSISL